MTSAMVHSVKVLTTQSTLRSSIGNCCPSRPTTSTGNVTEAIRSDAKATARADGSTASNRSTPAG